MATASTDGDFSAHTLQPWAQAHRFQCLIHTTRREARGPHTCLCAWRLPGPQTSEADVAPRPRLVPAGGLAPSELSKPRDLLSSLRFTHFIAGSHLLVGFHGETFPVLL